jgi:hypothetical protein
MSRRPDRFELEVEIVEQVDDQLLRLARAWRSPSLRHRGHGSCSGSRRSRRRSRRSRAPQHPNATCRARTSALRVATRALSAPRAALGLVLRSRSWRSSRLARRRAQHVVRELDARTSRRSSMRSRRRLTSVARRQAPLPPAAKRVSTRSSARLSRKPDSREHLVLDEATARLAAGRRARARRTRAGSCRASREQVGRDLAAALGDARVVELAAHEREERGLDLGVAQLRPPATKRTMASAPPRTRAARRASMHGGQRLLRRHARKPHAVLRDRGIVPSGPRVRQVVLAQRDQHAVVGARRNRTARRSTRRSRASRSSAFGGRFSTRSARSSMNSAARCAPKSSPGRA